MPAVGCRNLVSRLKTVVLPAPFGPISAWIWPSMDVEVDVLDGDEARELLAEAAGGEHRRVAAPGPGALARARPCSSPVTSGQPLSAGSMKASSAGTVARTL